MEHLQKLSQELIELSKGVSPWVVRVNGRRGPNATGLLWSDRVVITSHKACHRDSEIEVGLSDGSVVMAKVTGRAPDYDLATLELPEALSKFEEIPWSEAEVPGLVVALARNRKDALLTKLGLIPTEDLTHRIAPAPEFLGSPLVDSSGGFLGIHLLAGKPKLVSRVQLTEMLTRLSDQAHIEPAFLGLGLHRVPSESGHSCLVVRAEGPAASGGVLIGDHLLTINGESVEDPQQVRELVRAQAAGSNTTIEVLRAGKTMTFTVTLGARPHRGGSFPGMIKKHIKRVIRHLHHHHGPDHHHGPPHHHRRHHHHHRHSHHEPGPPPPNEGPDLC